MRCIFCLLEKRESEEHVFPLSVGGSLVTKRVCADCNSWLGSNVDTWLTNEFVIEHYRTNLGLASNKGNVPPPYKILIGESDLVGHGATKKVSVTFNEKTQKLDIRQQYSAVEEVNEAGIKSVNVSIDARDVKQIPKIIAGIRKKYKLPPLSDEEMAVEATRYTLKEIQQPLIKREIRIDRRKLDHALLKIVYELAFLWLGEAYLDDPLAAKIRAAVLSDEPLANLEGWFGDAGQCPAFSQWIPHKAHHLAISNAVENRIAVAVRVFDVHAACVTVTTNLQAYLKDRNGEQQLRFLAMDARNKELYEVSLHQELIRLGQLMNAVQHGPPFFDPLKQ